MDPLIKAKYDKAENLLSQAKEELCKPEEDVVPYVVCKSAFQSVKDYLTSFLIYHKAHIPEAESIENLLKKCREIDARFKDLHLSPLYNPTQTDHVWMNLDAAKDFLDMADKTRILVMRPDDRI